MMDTEMPTLTAAPAMVTIEPGNLLRMMVSIGSIRRSTSPCGFNRRTYALQIGGRALKHCPPSSPNLPCILGSTNPDWTLSFTSAAEVSALAAKSGRGQRENAALNVARTRDRPLDALTVCRGGYAIEARIVQRAVESDAADRYHGAVLTHADDRVVASIGDIEI